MQYKMAIKRKYKITLSLLFPLTVAWVIISYPNNYAKEELQRRYKINDQMWLYMTKNSHGGATLPIVYRYYLAGELKVNDSAILSQLNSKTLILEGTGTVYKIEADNNFNVLIHYSGKVFTLNRNVKYNYAQKNITASVSYKIN